MTGTTEGDALARVSAREIDAWLGRVTGIAQGPSAAELQASFSWRVTAPIRRAQVRQRLASLRSGGFGRIARVEGTPGSREAGRAFQQRLLAIAPHLLGGPRPATIAAGQLLAELYHVTKNADDRSALWLLVVAVSGCFPDEAFLLGLARDIEGVDDSHAIIRLLNHCAVWTERHSSAYREIRVVTGPEVLAIVDFTRKYGFNSGIQRVTRETMSRWDAAGLPVHLAAYTDDYCALRELHEDERRRVVAWDQSMAKEVSELEDEDATILVPWNGTVFLPELLAGTPAVIMRTLAQYARCRTVAIGYDTIPLSSGRNVARGENRNFSSYLAAVKHFDEIVAISESAASEFAGFVDAVNVQGLPGPRVSSVVLPVERIPSPETEAEPVVRDLPSVLTVGSNEPRKNQIAVVYASEVLWREGHRFELVVMGGRGGRYATEVTDAIAALQLEGRPIRVVRDASEDALAQAYRDARFSVFVSIHEGYGLPVTESLAVGTPAITSGYGSTAEIADGGGCVLVDPRDDDAIVAAMRRLLTDDAEIERLVEEIRVRPMSSWQDYADAIAALLFDGSRRGEGR